MFIICSTGRCATKALCQALGRFSDHYVLHEPPPTLLRESYLKYRGIAFQTFALRMKMAFLAMCDGVRYGEAFRGVALLPEVAMAAPHCRCLLLVRDPYEYIRSACAMKVMQRGDKWDQYRLVANDDLNQPLVRRVAEHWKTVNEQLLQFHATGRAGVYLCIARQLERHCSVLGDLIGAKIRNTAACELLLAGRPNASNERSAPEFNKRDVADIVEDIWSRALQVAVVQ